MADSPDAKPPEGDAAQAVPAATPSRGWRAMAAFGLPTLLLLAWIVWPLAAGTETLIARDVLHVHLTVKQAQARALRDGYLPEIDPYEGGQPLLGNPNGVPLYPDNLLYLLAPTLWALNAHFWLHLLLAPLAGYWLGRAWGLPPPAAWATGVSYGVSGFLLSQLNFYNLVAAAVLAPALVAAVLAAGARRRWGAPVAGALWALLLLSGAPLTVGMAGLLAAGALLARHGWRLGGGRLVGRLALAGGLGTLVALPQIVEFVRVLPTAARSVIGFTDLRSVVWSWHPARVVEWLVPIPFGRYDLGGPGRFWGFRLYYAKEPFFLSLYPGLLALGLVAASGRPRSRAAWWGWGAVASGLFLSLGGRTPVGRWLLHLPGGDVFRYPVKAWLLVAVGASLLCGLGFDRAFAGRRAGRRALVAALAALVVVLAAVLVFVVAAPERFEGWVLEVAASHSSPALAAAERARWIATLVASLVLGLVLLLVTLSGRKRPLAAAALLLALHTGGQLVFLRSLLLTDEAARYRAPPPIAKAIPPGATVVSYGFVRLEPDPPLAAWPEGRMAYLVRQWHDELRPFAGVGEGFHYELYLSAEGLSSYLTHFARGRLQAAGDRERVRALRRWGVDVVITPVPLRGVPPSEARPLARAQGAIRPVFAYRLPGAAAEVLLAEQVIGTSDPIAAWRELISPAFDPERQALLPGPAGGGAFAVPAEGRASAAGALRLLGSGPESVSAEVRLAAPGALVVQRAYLPIWRATVDGREAEVEPANVYRLAVRVPAGRHRVRLWVDRRPLWIAGGFSAAGVFGLLAWSARARWRREPEQVEGAAEHV